MAEWDQLCRWVIGAETGHDWGQLTTIEVRGSHGRGLRISIGSGWQNRNFVLGRRVLGGGLAFGILFLFEPF